MSSFVLRLHQIFTVWLHFNKSTKTPTLLLSLMSSIRLLPGGREKVSFSGFVELTVFVLRLESEMLECLELAVIMTCSSLWYDGNFIGLYAVSESRWLWIFWHTAQIIPNGLLSFVYFHITVCYKARRPALYDDVLKWIVCVSEQCNANSAPTVFFVSSLFPSMTVNCAISLITLLRIMVLNQIRVLLLVTIAEPSKVPENHAFKVL